MKKFRRASRPALLELAIKDRANEINRAVEEAEHSIDPQRIHEIYLKNPTGDFNWTYITYNLAMSDVYGDQNNNDQQMSRTEFYGLYSQSVSFDDVARIMLGEPFDSFSKSFDNIFYHIAKPLVGFVVKANRRDDAIRLARRIITTFDLHEKYPELLGNLRQAFPKVLTEETTTELFAGVSL